MRTISIIIPVYNKEPYLEELFADLLAQSFSDFECIIVDDGSTDNSGKICDKIAAKDERFRILHIPNGGVSNARNCGMKIACGDYMTFIDSDDRLHPDYLGNLLNCIQKSGADIVIGNHMTLFTENNALEPALMPCIGKNTAQECFPNFGAIQKNFGLLGWCWAKLMPRELALKSKFNQELKLAEDLDYYLGIYPHLKTIYFDDKPYYYYRANAENSSVRIDDDKIDYFAQFKLNLKLRNFFIVQNVYSAGNRLYVDERLSSYAFLTLFHCNLDILYLHYQTLKNLIKDNSLVLSGKSFLQKFCLLQLKMPDFIGVATLKMTLISYRGIRRLFHKIIISGRK